MIIQKINSILNTKTHRLIFTDPCEVHFGAFTDCNKSSFITSLSGWRHLQHGNAFSGIYQQFKGWMTLGYP